MCVRWGVDKGGGLCLGLGSEWRPMCEQHSIKHTDYQVNTHIDILTELNKRGASEVHAQEELPSDERSQAGQIK